ncbi:unnamed protein product [Boreogadus saida]
MAEPGAARALAPRDAVWQQVLHGHCCCSACPISELSPTPGTRYLPARSCPCAREPQSAHSTAPSVGNTAKRLSDPQCVPGLSSGYGVRCLAGGSLWRLWLVSAQDELHHLQYHFYIQPTGMDNSRIGPRLDGKSLNCWCSRNTRSYAGPRWTLSRVQHRSPQYCLWPLGGFGGAVSPAAVQLVAPRFRQGTL